MTADEGIWQRRSWPPGWDVRFVERTGSTNDDLRTALVAGDAGDRSVLAAGHQTAGRGRLDRRWEAPPGANLLVSIGFVVVPDPPVELTHRVGLAIVGALRALAPDAGRVGLKWPNDVLLDGGKVAGVLAAVAPRGDGTDAVVVGAGVNVGWAPGGASRLGAGHHPADVLAEVLNRYDALPEEIVAPYRDELLTLRQRVRVHLPGDREIVGRAMDVGADGRLHVLDEYAIPANDVRDRPIPLRGVAARGKGPQLAYALEHTAELLADLEQYFDIAYPYDKLDIVAVPDFAFRRDGERGR